MRTVLVYDEGPGRGLGHRRRMEALADALLACGVDVALSALDDGIPTVDVIVVDSYAHRADDRALFCARHIAAVDDLCRDLAVTVVVDPAPGASPNEHPGATTALTGSRFSLVDPALMKLKPTKIGAEAHSVLVATGGTDTAGHGAIIADDLAVRLPESGVRVAIGPWSSAPGLGRAIPLRTADGLSDELAKSDLVVTAGGVTMLEALALGRPTIAVVTADNQRRYVDGAARAGAVVASSIEHAAESAAALAADHRLRSRMARAATQLVDGQGARRVAEAIVSAV